MIARTIPKAAQTIGIVGLLGALWIAPPLRADEQQPGGAPSDQPPAADDIDMVAPNASDTAVRTRTEIIQLIEEKLSEAYSFTPSSVHQLPHFEVLDEIHPKWHHGKPAIGRQFWIVAKYRAFLVFYRVDYVHIVNSVMVKVRGKKLFYWTKRDDVPRLEKIWPFQFWAALADRERRDDNYLHASYAVRFGMKLSKDKSERWVITEEKTYDSPAMDNNIEDHCLYEKQLQDLGLRNDCGAESLIPTG